MIHQLAIRLRCFRGLLPIGVGHERRPVLQAFFLAGMLQNVDQRVIFVVLRNPVTDALHVVPVENLDSVVAEARLQVVQLAGIGKILPIFEYMIGGLCMSLGNHTDAQHNHGAHGERCEVGNLHAF